MTNIKDGRSRRKRPTKNQVTSKQRQWDPNEHPIFSSGMDGGMTQGHLYLKHSMPNIKDGRSRRKRPTKDQVTSKQPQWDPNEHPIFSSKDQLKTLNPVLYLFFSWSLVGLSWSLVDL